MRLWSKIKEIMNAPEDNFSGIHNCYFADVLKKATPKYEEFANLDVSTATQRKLDELRYAAVTSLISLQKKILTECTEIEQNHKKSIVEDFYYPKENVDRKNQLLKVMSFYPVFETGEESYIENMKLKLTELGLDIPVEVSYWDNKDISKSIEVPDIKGCVLLRSILRDWKLDITLINTKLLASSNRETGDIYLAFVALQTNVEFELFKVNQICDAEDNIGHSLDRQRVKNLWVEFERLLNECIVANGKGILKIRHTVG